MIVFQLRTSFEMPIYVYFYKDFPRKGARRKIDKELLLKESVERITKNKEDGLCDPSIVTMF